MDNKDVIILILISALMFVAGCICSVLAFGEIEQNYINTGVMVRGDQVYQITKMEINKHE